MYSRGTLLCSLLLFSVFGHSAQADPLQYRVFDIALKSGESTELTDVFYVGGNCKSLLTAIPEVEILDGPPGVTAVVHASSVVPHAYNCAKPVRGGVLVISARDIREYSHTQMLLRVKLKTSVGDRQTTLTVNIALLPAE